MRGAKIVDYLLDGLGSDLFDNGDNSRLPVWERRDGISAKQIVALQEHHASSGKSMNQRLEMATNNVNIDQMNLKQVRAALEQFSFEHGDGAGGVSNDEPTLGKKEQSQLLKRHKDLLVKELCQLRREQASLKVQLTTMPHNASALKSETLERSKDIDNSKSLLKAESLRVHGKPGLAQLAEGQLADLIARLSQLRLRQADLACGNRAGAQSLVVETELRAMDEEKRKLKREAQENFGVRISGKAVSAKRWKQLWKRY
jgi:hypothetical protein